MELDDLGAPGLDAPDFGGALDSLIASGKVQMAAKEAERLRPGQVDAAITGNLPRRPVSLAYRVHLVLVAIAMAAIPLAYVCLVAAAGIGVLYYVTQTIPALASHTPRGRAAILYLGAITAPAVAGAILVLFLIKPLFFRIRSEGRRRSLTRNAEPLLFDLVDRICDAIGAPKPARIDVDYQVNASAQPHGGMLGIATGKMVLTIGVPLISGLTSRQLAGVLAHEFGHFSQKIGMGASLVIRKVNWWLARVVYQRDALDQMLDAAIEDSDSWLSLIFMLGQLCVSASRGVLWCFMVVGHAISAGLMRQMEYDADRYEYGLVGSDTFAETFGRMRLVGSAHESSIALLSQLFLKGKLADDMLIVSDHIQRSLPPDAHRHVMEMIAKEKGGVLDTHPTDAARIARATSAHCDGCFNLDRPARDLIRHYDGLCKNVTWDFYRDQLGTQIMPQQLVPTKPLLAQLASATAGPSQAAR